MKRLAFWFVLAFLALLANSAYLFAFASPTIFYMANVLVHVGLGVVLLGAFCWYVRRHRGGDRFVGWVPTVLLLAGAGLGLYLIKNNTTQQQYALWAHIVVALAGTACLLPALARWARLDATWRRYQWATQGLLAACVVLPMAVYGYQKWNPNPKDRIVNSIHVATSMEEEGGGKDSRFWPSAARTNVKGTVPSNFFMDSAQCGTCHKDIYEQWNSSAHHFASFNNQFYRKSIEYMQDVQGTTKPSQWCAGCHDHAVVFAGKWDRPMKEQIDTPEAQTGLGCISCHAISHVDGTAGNGGFTMEYNDLHDLAGSRNKYMQMLDRFLTFTEPAPHRKTFLKPFMREDSAEYCASCHKVHLDKPVNNYRWIRGFNDYDNWQASAVSGQGARSFYYPPKASTCSGCHMPLVKSQDPGNRDGWVHSHRFPGANTALPYVNKDQTQLKVQQDFLQSGFISVDIFAASPVETAKGEPQMLRRKTEGPQLMSSMAVGEEGEQHAATFLREVGRVAAPLNRTPTKFKPGETVRLDVVVRTKKIGHFFPGGTVDAFDIWLELEAKDQAGKHIFWSGRVEDEGKGPVEPGAHFYRSYQLDAEGNHINKRNAWATRSLLYVRLIPPGAADTVHYRMKIPEDAKGEITLSAKLNYRKFSHFYTQFAYAGAAKDGHAPGRCRSITTAGRLRLTRAASRQRVGAGEG